MPTTDSGTAPPPPGRFLADWFDRPQALAAAAVVAAAEVRHALLRSLARRDEPTLAALSYVAAEDHLLIVGAEALLPWADGAVYLGCEPATPGLLVPTSSAPNVPLGLFERALRRQTGIAAGLLAVVAHSRTVIDASDLRPLSGPALNALSQPPDASEIA